MILGWLRSRAPWITIGVIALILMIWFAGPLFAFGEVRPLESVAARCTLIGLIVVYFLLRLIVIRWRAGRMNERVAGMLRATLSATSQESRAQTNILRDRFAEALEILRKARFGTERPTLWNRITRHGRYVYELPWYLIIGAPGVGKTTALLNSGLSFPLSKQLGAAAIRGAGGTRHCDWWFTNEAVFIDTAGRYTTHEADVETDKAEWRGFLSLLKKNRTRQPINGVLVMLSVSELFGQTLEERQKHAATLRLRLDELRNDLGMSFPVYLLVNKCDLLLGFDEYFSSLDRSGRAQVWGYTLPLAPSGKYSFQPETLGAEFDLLQARIADGLVDVLQGEPDLSRRELVYTFPQQFDALTQILKEMTADLLDTSRFSDSPFLRGIYFTSATQEGTPLDRIVHALGQEFQVQRPRKMPVAGEGKAYFLQELLSKVVFSEAHIASLDRRAERRSHAWHVGGYVASVFALAGAALVWAGSYRNNLTYIGEVDQKLVEFQKELSRLPPENNANLGLLMPILDRVETLPDSASFPADRPLLPWRFGLYQGAKLKAGAGRLYRQVLTKRLSPNIKTNLEQWLRSVDIGDMELSYEVLKAYLMMYEPEHLSGGDFIAFSQALWGRDVPGGIPPGDRHIRALVAMNALTPSLPMDEALVRSTRERLKQYTTAQRAYHRLARTLQNNQLPEFSVASEAGTQAGMVFVFKSGRSLTQGIPSLYSYRGYHELFKPKLGLALSFVEKDESWVLGVTRNTGGVAMDVITGKNALDVERLYVADYISFWEKYIGDLSLAEPQDLREAAQIVDQLSGVDSPLRRFMQGVVRETTLVKDAPKETQAPPAALGRAQQAASSTVNTLRNLVPAGTPDPLAPKDQPALAVNRRFSALHNFVNGSNGDGSNAPMNQMMKRLEDLRMLLADALYRQENRMPMPDTVSVTQLLTSLGGTPEPFKGIARSAAENGRKIIRRESERKFVADVQTEVSVFCKKTIAGRYPFNPRASSEVTDGAFADMFGLNGKMEQFRQQQPPGTVLPEAFDQARIIRDVFFRNGNTPQMTFTIKPLVMDTTITILNLNIGGQTIRYDHGPIVPTSVTWPTGSGSHVRVSLLPVVEGGANTVSIDGLWAMHRLFERYGRIRNGSSPDVFEVVLTIGGRRAILEVRPTSVRNPFNLPELTRFRCP